MGSNIMQYYNSSVTIPFSTMDGGKKYHTGHWFQVVKYEVEDNDTAY